MSHVEPIDLIPASPVELDWHPVWVDATATVSQVLGHMCQQGNAVAIEGRSAPWNSENRGRGHISYVLVRAGGQLAGIFTERDVLRLTAQNMDLDSLPIEACMTCDPITLDQTKVRNPSSALAILRHYRIRHLPVVDSKGQVVGVATAETLRRSIRLRDFLRLRQVREAMAREMVTATVQESVISLVQRMIDRQVSCVVIVEAGSAEGLCPIGIVTERDVVQMRNLQLDLGRLTAGEVMSTPLEWITPEQSLWDVQQTMERLRVRRLVVVEQDVLVGIMTQTSILNALDPVEMYNTIELLQAEIDQLKQEQIGLLKQQTVDLQHQVSLSERRFQAIFNNTFQFTGLMTPEGILIEANQTALDFGGITRDQVINRPFWEIYWWSISPETQEQVRQASERAAQGEFVRYEVDVLGAGGRIMTIDFSLRPLRDAQGNVVLLIPEGRDITEFKQTQQALEFQVKFDRLVANISKQFIQLKPAAIDAATTAALAAIGEFTQVDSCYVFRYGQQQLLHSMTHEWVSPGIESSQQRCQDLPVAMFPWATEQLQRGEVVHIADIETLPPAAAIDRQTFQQFGVRSTLTLPLRQHDCVIGLVGFACLHQHRNWTDDNVQLLRSFADVLANALQRQQADTELRDSEQRYASLTAAAPVGIYRTDTDGNCLYVNDRWSQIAGMSPDAALGEGWVNGLHLDDRERISSEWYQAAQANRPFQLEYRFQRADGSVSWVFGQAVAERDATGQIISYVGTITDITDRKAAEKALKQQRDLNQLIAEITSRFVDVGIAALDGEIDRALQLIGAMMAIDITYLFQWDADGLTMRMTHEWNQSDQPRQMPLAQTIPLAAFPWSIAQLNQRQLLYVRSVADLPAEVAIDQASWQLFNVMGMLGVPLIQRSAVVGFVGFASYCQPLTWDAETMRLLQVLAQTIANAQVRVQDERQLYENEERLRLALAAANQGLYDLDLQTGDTIVSPEYATMLGYDSATFQETKDRWIERLHPDDREPVAQVYQNYVAGLIPEYKVELRQRTRSGDWHWILALGKVVDWDEAGNPIRMLGTHTDINDRKAAEAERLQSQLLRNELKLLENILDVILAGYWDWDIPNQREYLSPGFKRMFGYEDDELPNVPESWQRLIFPEDLPSVLDCFEQHVQSHGQVPFYNEVRYHHKNGSTIWVLCSGQVIEWDGAGNPLRMVGCHVDISDRKQTELELKQLNQELARSNQDLEQFAYITSHDLQEPLRAIIGYSQLLSENYRDVLRDELAQESLGFILDGGQRMRLLIQDLLTYSRIGSQPLRMLKTDCNKALGEVLQNLKSRIDEHQVIISADPLPSLALDKTQFVQLLQNLISNAIKFRRETPPHIQIRVVPNNTDLSTDRPTDRAPAYLFSVQDNGIGIKPQYLTQIFEIFRRLHSLSKFPGTGIGLAICKKIVERHGGEIWAISERDKGTTFFFTLPCSPDDGNLDPTDLNL